MTSLEALTHRSVMALLAAVVLSLPLAALAGDVGDGAASPAVSVETPQQFYVDDIKEAMLTHIKARVDEDGVFRIRDQVTDELLALRFVKIHDPVRQIDGNTYFACTDFHVVGNEKKLYDLDFWMNPATGELKIYEEKIHKEPRRSLLYGWYKHARYTFVNDRVVEIY